MRSSVLDTSRSPKVEVRESGREAQYTSFNRPPAQKSDRRPLGKPEPRFVHFLKKLTPAEGWLAFLLLAVALYSVVFSITVANWVAHSTLLFWSPVIGLVAGLIIAKVPRMPQPILHLAACVVGYWLAVWLTSSMAYRISWLVLLAGLRDAVTGSISGTLPATEILFFFYLAFLTYFLGYFGSWLVYRARLPWLVALVYCSILLVNLNYVKQDRSYLVVILAGALVLLIARIQLVNQIAQWTREGLHTDRPWLRKMTTRAMQGACLLTVVVLLTGWLLPAVKQPDAGKNLWQSVDNAWTNVINGRASLQNPKGIFQPYQAPTNFFGDQLFVGGNVHLPPGDVLRYTGSPSGPQYLAGFTYNNFDGHTWTTSLTSNFTRNVDANGTLPVDSLGNGSTQVTVDVTVLQPPAGTKSYIFGPPQPVSFNVPVTVYTDGKITGAWTAQNPLTKGARYSVTSAVPPTDAQTLSSVPLPADQQDVWRADKNYASLALYYMQVPQDLSSNARALTKQWTNGATNAYIALKMLEKRLSDPTQFTYSLDNPSAPNNVDAIDWLLQTKIGYCTYYASAMAVMGRILGVPTRVINGFTQGHYDPRQKAWVVQGSDAHSWVQAYFPSFGWISFDPTPGFSQGAAPASQVTPQPVPAKAAAKPTVVPTPKKQVINQPQQQPASRPSVQSAAPKNVTGNVNQNFLIWLSAFVLLISILVFLTAAITYWWRTLYRNSTFVAGMFWRLCWIASRAGLAPSSWQTPYEYSRMLSQYFPQKATPLWHLTELFVRDRWGAPSQVPQQREVEHIEQLWPTLRQMFFQLWMRKRK